MKWKFIIAVFLYANFTFAQDTIFLKNPTFDGVRGPGKENGVLIQGWYDCNKAGETFVDLQPGSFRVKLPGYDGSSYLGMCTRYDESWEGISQRLSTALKANRLYGFALYLAQSDSMISKTSREREEDFMIPVKLRLLGASNHCEARQILAESPLIAHQDWRKYIFTFTPEHDYEYFIIEAFYKTPCLFPYNGYILVDHCSPIHELSSEEDAEKIFADH